ncbi:hypothetical protein [Rhodopila sp.]|uniref:hypothetical protein n=1 Tax=Rhodopila sp. TaxID=2480087 RepID=UPI003D14FD30
MGKRLRALLNGSLRRPGANLGRFGGNSSVVQRANYKDYSEDGGQARDSRPESLFLGRYSSAPSYAKIGLMAGLGWLASTLINESGIRRFHDRRQGEIWYACGVLCIAVGIIAALMLA